MRIFQILMTYLEMSRSRKDFSHCQNSINKKKYPSMALIILCESMLCLRLISNIGLAVLSLLLHSGLDAQTRSCFLSKSEQSDVCSGPKVTCQCVSFLSCSHMKPRVILFLHCVVLGPIPSL